MEQNPIRKRDSSEESVTIGYRIAVGIALAILGYLLLTKGIPAILTILEAETSPVVTEVQTELETGKNGLSEFQKGVESLP